MPEQDPVEGPRSFAVFMRQLADGDAEREASAKLHELLAALREEAEAAGGAAKGGLTLKFDVKVDKLGQVTINYDVTPKYPKPSRPEARVWLNEGNNVIFENPRQAKLFPREVEVTGKIREVSVKAHEAREV